MGPQSRRSLTRSAYARRRSKAEASALSLARARLPRCCSASTFTRGTITQAHLTLTPVAKWSLIAAAGLFALAAIAGVLSNLPLPYNEALVRVLREWTRLADWYK